MCFNKEIAPEGIYELERIEQYLSSAHTRKGHPNPKTRIQLWDVINKGDIMGFGSYGEALAKYRRVFRKRCQVVHRF